MRSATTFGASCPLSVQELEKRIGWGRLRAKSFAALPWFWFTLIVALAGGVAIFIEDDDLPGTLHWLQNWGIPVMLPLLGAFYVLVGLYGLSRARSALGAWDRNVHRGEGRLVSFASSADEWVVIGDRGIFILGPSFHRTKFVAANGDRTVVFTFRRSSEGAEVGLGWMVKLAEFGDPEDREEDLREGTKPRAWWALSAGQEVLVRRAARELARTRPNVEVREAEPPAE